MTADHVNRSLLNNQYDFLYYIGRFALPIFCFLVARNYFLTRNASRYALRLFAFALLSQPVFYLALDAHYPNILFTLGFSVLLLQCIDNRKYLLCLPIGLLMLFCDGGYIALGIVLGCYCIFRLFGVPMSYQFKHCISTNKWFFYAFYPGHLLGLFLIGAVING